MRQTRRVLGAVAALALSALATDGARAETYELETYYPSPIGVYNAVRSRQYRFIAYATRAEMNVAPMPAPGTFAYCTETGRYYASSAQAVAGDTATWWHKVMLDDTPESLYAAGSMDFLQPNNSYAWTKVFSVDVGKLYSSNNFIRSVIKINQAGSYTAAATGRVCQVLANGGTNFVGPSNATVFRLRLRLNGTYVGDQTSFSLTPAPDQENDCYFDPSDGSIVTAGGPAACYCAPFSLSGSLNLPVGNLPYVGLLSYGAKTATTPLWNIVRRYGGYIVHVDEIKIYR